MAVVGSATGALPAQALRLDSFSTRPWTIKQGTLGLWEKPAKVIYYTASAV